MWRIPILVLTYTFFLIPGQTQVRLDFKATPTSGCAPVIVQLDDLSAQAVSWEWDWGTGSSTLRNPVALFTQAGTYDVRLITTDGNGQKDTLVKTAYIHIAEEPTAQFQASPRKACTFESIRFINQSTTNGGIITSFLWDFGDGNTSPLENPTHTYQAPGSYPVSLTINTDVGCSEQIIYHDLITIQAPDPSFTADKQVACGPPLVVQFQGTTPTAQHIWDFGNGQVGTGQFSSQTYQSNGAFEVRHIVIDGDGCRDTLVKPSYINIGINTLSIFAEDSSVCLKDSVRFFTNAAANSQAIWDFGNGDSATTLHPVYKYPSPGVFIATATISDQSGCSVSLSIPIEVFDYPKVDFEVRDTTLGCEIPFSVDFEYTGVGGHTFIWRMGDGTNISGKNPSHTYEVADSFRVGLIVIGENDCSSSLYKRDYIQIVPTEAEFEVDRRGGCAPFLVQFYDSSTSAYPITRWEWDFGDGTTSNLPNPTHTFTDTGYYDIRLIITNSQGCTDTIFRPKYIGSGTLPQLGFYPDTNQACALTDVQLVNTSQGANSFIWFFADGDTAMSVSPTHGFGTLGLQDIILFGSDKGCADTLLQRNVLNILAPLPSLALSTRKACQIPQTVLATNLSIAYDSYYWQVDGHRFDDIPVLSYQITQPENVWFSLTVTNDSTGCTLEIRDSVLVSPVEAQFRVDTPRGCAPIRIQYTNESQNATRYLWHFTDRDSSLSIHPNFTYQQVGEYTTRLIARNPAGCKDTVFLDPISALGVQADFGWSGDSIGCVPLEVGLVDLSTGTSPIAAWNWELGDGTSLQGPNPQHTYDSMAYYTIKLTVTDEDGCVDSISEENAVYATEPIPNFRITPPINCVDVSSTFVSLSTGAGLSYQWDFGDGSTSTLANPTHAYIDTGFYDVHLSVTDVNGCDSSLFVPQAVNIRTLAARFTADSTYTTCPPLSVNFLADTAFPHPDITYSWDFGDGATSNEPNPVHVYTLPGMYTVQLIVSTIGGCTDTLTMNEFIEVEGPEATFSLGPGEGCPGTTVNFVAEADTNIGLSWVLGDGSLAEGKEVNHTYHQAGTWTPILVAEDSGGCKVFHLGNEDITIFEAPVAQFSADDTIHCDAGQTTLTDQSTSPYTLTNWQWSLSDGTTHNLQQAVIDLDKLGAFDINLIVTDDKGCADTLFKPAYLQVVPAPQPIALADTLAGCVPFQSTLRVNVDNHPTPIQEVRWDFDENGQSSSGSQVNYTYQHSGTYFPSVLVTDIHGCQGDTSLSLRAWALPEVTFTQGDSMGCAPIEIPFEALPSPSTTLQSVEWDFGDGTSTTDMKPTHLYQQDGTYAVSLRVIDQNGCTQSVQKDQLIHLAHPSANFQASDTAICPGTHVTFTDLSLSDTILTGWEWLFGQGDSSDSPTPATTYEVPGTYDVSLRVTDVFGCRDTQTWGQLIRVIADIQPTPLDLKAVSVVDDRQITLSLQPFPNQHQDFHAYHIFRQKPGSAFQEVLTLDQIDQLQTQDEATALATTSTCYKVVVENQCGTRGLLEEAPIHCTIDLTARVDTEQVQLTWNPYIGWEGIEAYRLYRVQGYQPQGRVLMAELPASALSYTDEDMYCTDTYSYQIEAIGNLRQQSFSDTAFAAPPHRFPSQPSHILRASVENNAFIQVTWEAAPIEDAVAVVLERGRPGGFKQVFKQPIHSLNQKYQDDNTDVSAQSYTYRVFTVDTCGDYTPLGHIGKTIHLTVRQQNGQVRLNWTPYEGWEDGVEQYQIEVYRESTGAFETIAQVDGQTQQYADPATEMDQAINCYRIIATETGNAQMTSYSNEACTPLAPQLYSPNAFSPNGDGKNDQFKLTGVFLSQANLSIFDRWGKQIYTSASLDEGWDGYLADGSPAPEGVYVFRIYGQGLSGTYLEHSGSITLIR